ncbi:XRE family transcriptional regulator [Flavobacterium sp. RHBU_24]|uniref:XRE family transcriptional regulator n=1 Tax=Flavobacterium sp. RHBU_24 TaxID=3391185 RepID=UPI003984C869
MKKMKNNWDDISYQQIETATIANGQIQVTFANSDKIELPVSTLLPVDINVDKIQEIHNSDFDISINFNGGFEYLIPWDKVRTLTDKSFAREMAKQAEDNAKLTGERLKTLRERKHIKSNQLAEMAGVTPQTITRIEKGHTDVGFGTLRKILAAMGYTLKDLANEELFEAKLQNIVSFEFILKKLAKIGIDSNLVRKIIPVEIIDSIRNKKENLPDLIQSEISAYLSQVFGWRSDEIWKEDDLPLSNLPFKLALFKTPSKGNISQIRAYSHYAYYIANIVRKAENSTPQVEYPGDLKEFKSDFYRSYSELTLKNLLSFAWDLGICVIPLNDQGVFHGASWNIKDKHVVVLKQKNESHARWIFDLLHELYHVFAHLDVPNTSVIEIEEVNPFSNNASLEEREANTFANHFIFGSRSEEIAKIALSKADYKIDLLKNAVIATAKEEGIKAEFIANYLAFRLQMGGKNWWGTANNFQITSPSPFAIASEILRERIAIDNLNPIDKNMLESALRNI